MNHPLRVALAAGLTTLAMTGCSSGGSGSAMSASNNGSTNPGSTSSAVMTLAAGAANPTDAPVRPGTAGLATLQVSLRADALLDVTVTELTITAHGTCDDATAFSAVSLFLDADANGAVDATDVQLGTATGFPADDGSISFSGLTWLVPSGTMSHGLITMDLGGNAVIGQTFGVRITTNASLSAMEQATGAVLTIAGAPVEGPQFIIEPLIISPTVMIQPGPADGRDTYIKGYGLYQNDNYGNAQSISVGDRDTQPGSRRSFIEFPLGSIPTGVQIVRAEIRLFHSTSAFNNNDVSVRVHRVVETFNKNGAGASQTPWVEGAGGNDLILDGMAWDGDMNGGHYPYQDSNMPRFSQPDVDETTDHGFGPNGIIDEVKIGTTGNMWVTFDVTAAVVDWTTNNEPNYGLRLSHADEGAPFDEGVKSFYSSDYMTDPTLRPRLVVTFR